MDRYESGRHKVASSARVRLGTPEMRGTGVSELSLIAEVSEKIKEAVHASESISLIAINANLTAGRAGGRAAGFCVVASELRRFSERMVADMAAWSNVIYRVVRETAHGRKQAHVLYKLQETAGMTPKARAAIAAASERCRLELGESTQRNSECVIQLLDMIHRTEKQHMTGDMIHRTEKQHMTGEMIARSALIEAAYGGSMQPVLRQIAETIGHSLAGFTKFSEQVGRTMRRSLT